MINSIDSVVLVKEGWIDTDEASALSRYSLRYLRQLAREDRIEAHKIGRDWLFNRDSLIAWLEEMRTLGTQKHNPLRVRGNASTRHPEAQSA